ncbi:hypothetical protein [Acinetobacter baumannii]|uniref:hypothetical protein n=1 Tax=Acinetobacter baumannii TaxID=470 RepID=UPI001CEC2D0D|nr:hypothetical protein [Acinetobacter baumannii]
MINKVLIVLCVSIVFVLGYWAYLDTQNKRHQELMRIIQEAEKNLQTIERNPNRVSHSNLASYNLQKYIRDLCTKQPLCSRHTTKPKKNKEWQ